MEKDFVIKSLATLGNIKLAHFGTPLWAEHKALDKLYNLINEEMDSVAESWIGHGPGGRVPITHVNPLNILDEYMAYIVKLKMNPQVPPDVAGSLDGFLEKLFKMRYLLSFE